eukprot:PITA_03038
MNPTISCNSLVEITTPQTIEIEGHIKKKNVQEVKDHIEHQEVNLTISCKGLEEITTPQTLEIEGHIEKKKVQAQAPRAWYTRIDSYFTGLGFSKSEADPNLYQILVEGKLLIIVLYVDDLILTGDELLILSCKKDLATEFEMKDLGLLHYFLGLEIWQRSGGLFVSQGKYAREILEKFNMHGCKPVDTPLPGGWRKEDATSGEEVDATVYRQLVGSLMYLVNTRPDICYAVNQLSQAMVKPTKLFWKAGKHIGQGAQRTERAHQEGSSILDRQQFLGTAGNRDPWHSVQRRPSLWQQVWLHSCIKLSANPVFHDRSKHIDIRYHHIRDCVRWRIMLLSYIPTEDQDADILMKALTRSKFEYHRGRIGVADNPYLVKREC